MNKKGEKEGFGVAGITAFLLIIIAFLLFINIFAQTSPAMVDSFDSVTEVNQTEQLPLNDLYSSSGVVAISYAAQVLLLLIGAALFIGTVLKLRK